MSAQKLATNLRLAGSKGFVVEEMEFVYDTLAELRPDFICEWGTNVGHSARMFSEAAEILDLKCDIHSVDIVDKHPVLRPSEGKLGRGYHVRGRDVTLHVGDGLQVGVELYQELKPKRPLFFLDDNHEEEAVYHQMSVIQQLVPNAVMLVHDTMTSMKIGGDVFMVAHEPGKAALRFQSQHPNYQLDQIEEGQTMMRLWPR